MKTLILILSLFTINCFAEDKVKLNDLLSQCKKSEDKICSGLTNAKKELELKVKNTLPKELAIPSLTVLKLIQDKKIQFNNSIINNDKIILEQKRITYQLTFNFD